MQGKRLARGYAPAHVTGFFKIYANGSTGAGFNLEKGVTTTVKWVRGGGAREKGGRGNGANGNAVRVHINGKKSRAPVSRKVVEKYFALLGGRGNAGLRRGGDLEIRHRVDFPIGFGMGMSGAGAYSLSLALNELLGTRLTKKAAMDIARRAEIECGTGLGDVPAQDYRGLFMGLPPYPSKKAKELKCGERFAVCAFFSLIQTAKVIRSRAWKKKINRVGEKCMRALKEKPDEETFIQQCRVFALETGLANQRVRRVLEREQDTSMAMLGQTVFGLTNEPAALARRLRKYGDKVIVSKLNQTGARVV